MLLHDLSVCLPVPVHALLCIIDLAYLRSIQVYLRIMLRNYY